MDAHRSRSLGMAALIFILISLTATVFHGAAPVRAEDATTPTPIVINGDTADVKVKLYTDEYHTQELNGAVTSTSKLYGAFSAQFKNDEAPSPENYIAVYKLPDTIVVDDARGNLMEGPEASAAQAGTWKIEGNKVVFTFDEAWLKLNPAEIYVAANFSFQLANKDTGSGNSTSVVFPGEGSIDIPTKDGEVTGTKAGAFSQGSDGVAKVTWTVTLTVESYATNVSFTDTLGDNFSFVKGSFALDDRTLNPQPTIDGQVAILDSLGNLSWGDHTITYETALKSGVSANNGDLIKADNTATWNWAGSTDGDNKTATAEPVTFGYDMIDKSNGSGTPSDIKWTVRLNQGKFKADMSGYVFTDYLDGKQTYTGNYFTVYKGDSEASGVEIEKGNLDPKGQSFSYKFQDNLEDKYATYCIVYHTKMNDTSSYDTVRNNATIERKGSVFGTDEGSFTPQLTGVVPITKRLVRSNEAATTGRATWETKVALKAIVNAVHPDEVTVKDTFQSAWSQKLGVDESSITIKIGDTVLERGADWNPTASFPGNETKENYDLKIIVTNKVKDALEKEDYAVITYDTTSEALSGWYSNFASVSAPGLKLRWSFTEPVKYVVNQEKKPAVEKPEAESKVSWVENFDWHTVDGSDEKGA